MDFIAAIDDLTNAHSRPIIAIDGPAGAGKTTLAHNLFLAFSPSMKVQVIHMDDLYDGWENALSKDLSAVLGYLVDRHKKSLDFSLSTYNWDISKFNEAKNYHPSELLILEGVGCGQNSIRAELSALIWLEITPQAGLQRVIARDGSAVAQPMAQWLVMQNQHFADEHTQAEADFILST